MGFRWIEDELLVIFQKKLHRLNYSKKNCHIEPCRLQLHELRPLNKCMFSYFEEKMEGMNNARFLGFELKINRSKLICIHRYIIEEYDTHFFF